MKMTHIVFLLLAGMATILPTVKAQQLPLSGFQSVQAGLLNPGHFPELDRTEIFFSHAQRDVKFSGYDSGADFFHLQSGWLGKTDAFSIGLQLTHDREHTEQRLGISPSITAKVLQNRNSWFSLGISAGISSWRSVYGREIAENDPILLERSSFTDLDAGIGGRYHLESNLLKLDVEAMAIQLPGNLLSGSIPGLEILPHYQAKACALLDVFHNVKMGPLFSYGNVLSPKGYSYQKALAEVGGKAELENKGFWMAGSYRFDQSTLNLAWGLRAISSDSVVEEGQRPFQIDVQMAISYPRTMSAVFGPSIEVGLGISLGKVSLPIIDSLQNAAMFWNGEENLTLHRVKYLDANAPPGLDAKTAQDRKYVYLTYSFPDNDLSFAGQTPIFRGGELRKIGAEWPGVDGLLENLTSEVMVEALNPDTHLIRDPENLEALRSVSTIELTSLIRDKEFALHLSSEMRYEGEFGFSNPTEDTLFMEVVFDGIDTILGMTMTADLTNLELAGLKLYTIRAKLEYEMEKQFGEDYDILREGDSIDIEFYKPPIFIKIPRLVSDNPHQKEFQVNVLDLKFIRDKQFWEDDDEIIEPEEWARMRAEEKQSRGRKKKKKTRRK